MTRTMVRAAVAAVLLVGGLGAQKPEMPQDLAAAEQSWSNALRSADAKSLAEVLAEDFAWIAWDGTVLTRAQALDRTAKGDFKGGGVPSSDARIYGDTVVLSGTATNQIRTIKWTRVWIKQNGKWLAVLQQGTLVQPAEKK